MPIMPTSPARRRAGLLAAAALALGCAALAAVLWLRSGGDDARLETMIDEAPGPVGSGTPLAPGRALWTGENTEAAVLAGLVVEHVAERDGENGLRATGLESGVPHWSYLRTAATVVAWWTSEDAATVLWDDGKLTRHSPDTGNVLLQRQLADLPLELRVVGHSETLVISDGVALISRTFVQAVTADGEPSWTAVPSADCRFKAGFFEAAAAGETLVLVEFCGDSDDRSAVVVGLDAGSGEVRWSAGDDVLPFLADVDELSLRLQAAGDDRIAVINRNRHAFDADEVVILDLATGRPAATIAPGPGSTFDFHAGADGVLVSARITHYEVGVTQLAAFDAATGEQLWQQQSTEGRVAYTGWPRVVDGRVYLIERELLRDSSDGLARYTLVVLDLHGGAELARTPLSEFYDPDDSVHYTANLYLDHLGEGVIMAGLAEYGGVGLRHAAVVVAE